MTHISMRFSVDLTANMKGACSGSKVSHFSKGPKRTMRMKTTTITKTKVRMTAKRVENVCIASPASPATLRFPSELPKVETPSTITPTVSRSIQRMYPVIKAILQ